MPQILKLLALLLLFYCACNMPAPEQAKANQTVQAESVGLSTYSLHRMDSYMHRLVDSGQLAGIQTAIIRKGQLAHFDSYGYANIAEGKALDEQNIFRIFSMTKPIVSVGLMQLYEAGKLDLEAPLHIYLPEFREMKVYSDSALVAASEPIQIIDLLRHTSGFSYGRTPFEGLNRLYAEADLNASATNEEFVDKLSTLPLQFEPGSDWQYGLSTNICGRLIEVLSGQSLKDYLYGHVLEPLGMHDTHFQLPTEKVDRFTVGYQWSEENGLTIAEAQNDNRYVQEVTLFNGGGGLVSTTLDYLKFCQMILNKGSLNGHRILDGETVDLMLQDHLHEVRVFQDRIRLPPGEASFGLGFAIRGNEDGELEPVFGWGGAVGTYFKIDTQHDIAYVMMIQLSPYRQLGLRQVFQDFVESAIID